MNTDFSKMSPATQEAMLESIYDTLDAEVLAGMVSRKFKDNPKKGFLTNLATKKALQLGEWATDGITDIRGATLWDKAYLEAPKFQQAAGRSLGKALLAEGERRKKLQDDVYAKSYAKGQQSIVDLATKSQEARRKKLLGI